MAKELGVPVKKIREVLKEWGIEKGNFAYLDEEELQIVYDNLLPSKEKPVESVSIQEVKEETVQTVEVVKEEKAPREQRPKFQKPQEQKTKQFVKESSVVKKERTHEKEKPRRVEDRRPFPPRIGGSP